MRERRRVQGGWGTGGTEGRVTAVTLCVLCWALPSGGTWVLTQDAPIAHWPLDRDGVDASGRGRDLELAGGVGVAPDLAGQALDLVGDPRPFGRRPGDGAVLEFGSSAFTVKMCVKFRFSGFLVTPTCAAGDEQIFRITSVWRSFR